MHTDYWRTAVPHTVIHSALFRFFFLFIRYQSLPQQLLHHESQNDSGPVSFVVNSGKRKPGLSKAELRHLRCALSFSSGIIILTDLCISQHGSPLASPASLWGTRAPPDFQLFNVSDQCFSTFSVKRYPLQQFWLLTGDSWGPKGWRSRKLNSRSVKTYEYAPNFSISQHATFTKFSEEGNLSPESRSTLPSGREGDGYPFPHSTLWYLWRLNFHAFGVRRNLIIPTFNTGR